LQFPRTWASETQYSTVKTIKHNTMSQNLGDHVSLFLSFSGYILETEIIMLVGLLSLALSVLQMQATRLVAICKQ